LLDYYSKLTTRDANGIAVQFGAQAKIGGGQIANYSGQAQQVALFSSRGPDIKDFNFNQADILKPNVLAPGYLIWGAWTPIGIDNPNYIGELLNCKEKRKILILHDDLLNLSHSSTKALSLTNGKKKKRKNYLPPFCSLQITVTSVSGTLI
jgi:hypothetical protein